MVDVTAVTVKLPMMIMIALALVGATWSVNGEISARTNASDAISRHELSDAELNNVFRADITVLQISSALYRNDIDSIDQTLDKQDIKLDKILELIAKQKNIAP